MDRSRVCSWQLPRRSSGTAAIVVLGATALLLASCGLFAPRPQHDWLAGEPCRPPCWEGITPGVTSCAELEERLGQDPQVSELVVYGPPKVNPVGWGMNWKWPWGGAGVHCLCDTDLVVEVWSGVDKRLTLDDAITVYGEPSHVMVEAQPPTDNLAPPETVYVVEIYYLDQGFSLLLDGLVGSAPQIDGSLTFRSVHFFVPSMEGFLATVGNPRWEEIMVPWQGFRSFDEYECLAYPDSCENEGQP